MTGESETGTTRGTFAAAGQSWTYTGALTFADAAAVLEATQALPLPESGVVDLAGLAHADSAALAVLLALKRRAAAERRTLAFTSMPATLDSLARVYGIDDLLAS